VNLDLANGEMTLRIEQRFAAAEAARLREAVLALRPISRLDVRFAEELGAEEQALQVLARTVAELRSTVVTVRGLTLRQMKDLRRLLDQCVRGRARGAGS
jgi:flagellar biosynthesis regulator FlaF